VTRKLLLAVLLAGTCAIAHAQTGVDTGNTGGTQIYSGAGAHGAANDKNNRALIAGFNEHLSHALAALRRSRYREALADLYPYLDRNNPLLQDPSGIVPDSKLAEGYYARGLALAGLASSDTAHAKTDRKDSESDFKEAELLDPGIGARMAHKGFPRKS